MILCQTSRTVERRIILQEYEEVTPREQRAGLLENADVGDSVSLSTRFDTSYGMPDKRVSTEIARLRRTLDTQATRVRRKFRERKYVVECGSFLTAGQAIVVTVIATRLA